MDLIEDAEEQLRTNGVAVLEIPSDDHSQDNRHRGQVTSGRLRYAAKRLGAKIATKKFVDADGVECMYGFRIG